MNIKTKFRSWLYGASAGLLLTILIVPTLRGMFLLQLRMMLNSDSTQFLHPMAATAQKYPKDFQMQLAAAHLQKYEGFASGDTSAKMDAKEISNLRRFETSFPDNPSTYANVLRWMDDHSLMSARYENYLISPNPPRRDPNLHPAPRPYIDFYDQTAAAGERLDPDNAYFPMLRSACLFGENQDKEAMSELHRAAQDTELREYYTDEVEGQWKISDKQFGFENALSHGISVSEVSFPEYATIRGAARIELYKAMLAERSGDTRSGISIRLDIMRCGDLMRSKSPSVIGSIVGIAICGMSTDNAGGVVEPEIRTQEPTRDASTLSTVIDDNTPLSVIDYTNYLNRTGNGKLVPLVQEEMERTAQIKAIIARAIPIDVSGTEFSRSVQIVHIGTVLLCSIVILLLAGLLSLLILIEEKAVRLVRPVRITAYILFMVACVGFSVYFLYLSAQITGYWGGIQNASVTQLASIQTIGVAQVAISLSVFVVLAAIVVLTALRAGKIRLQHLPKACIICVSATLIISASVYETCRCNFGIGALYADLDPFGNVHEVHLEECLTVFAGILGPTLAVILGSIIIAVKAKMPLVPRILSSFKYASMPLACGLWIVLGGFLFSAIRQNERMIAFTQGSLADEGDYYARSVGSTWPRPLPLQNISLDSLQSHTVVDYTAKQR